MEYRNKYGSKGKGEHDSEGAQGILCPLRFVPFHFGDGGVGRRKISIISGMNGKLDFCTGCHVYIIYGIPYK